jgi:hypothetical protein
MSDNKLRKVKVMKIVKLAGMNKAEMIVAGEAIFHCFGMEFEEFRDPSGSSFPGQYSTGIVEWPDGKLENVPVNMLKFIEPAEGGQP